MLGGRPFWTVFLVIGVIGPMTWLAIFEHSYHARIYGYNNEEVTILQTGGSELDFNYPVEVFTIWRQTGRKHMKGVTTVRDDLVAMGPCP